MEKTIIDLIDKKALRQYQRLSIDKRKSYRAMLYAGLQVTLNKKSLKDVAVEIGYSEGGAYKLVQKWIEHMRNGDITVNLIITAFHKMQNRKKTTSAPKKPSSSVAKPAPKSITVAETPTEKPIPVPIKLEKPKPKVRNVLGFVITPEDERRERAAIRASILFFQSFGKGQTPRMRGEYYVPGTNPAEMEVDDSKWLPLDVAAHYCGCSESVINAAAQNGTIERRVYCRNANRNYYEYRLEDLDRFIRDNHLL